jgi:hypothetical protein
MYRIKHFRIVREDLTLEEFFALSKPVMDFVNDPAAPVKAMFSSMPAKNSDLCKAVLFAELDMDDPRLARLEELMAAKAVPANDSAIQ